MGELPAHLSGHYRVRQYAELYLCNRASWTGQRARPLFSVARTSCLASTIYTVALDTEFAKSSDGLNNQYRHHCAPFALADETLPAFFNSRSWRISRILALIAASESFRLNLASILSLISNSARGFSAPSSTASTRAYCVISHRWLAIRLCEQGYRLKNLRLSSFSQTTAFFHSRR
ncbi:hypothetical protein SAMN05216409_11895 [Pseudomonas lutea]|uniref:Uncharacterized protein n=1 Tax=Pseudomonas lutea TaxID=243924 RepID=A0A9X8MH56_9PSED|nr:hypothetical protein SAMN05216409_11895 [Pseudomonas lutea]